MTNLHTYRCLTCHTEEPRVAGLDDHFARCLCGGVMERTSDPFEPPTIRCLESALTAERRLTASLKANIDKAQAYILAQDKVIQDQKGVIEAIKREVEGGI